MWIELRILNRLTRRYEKDEPPKITGNTELPWPCEVEIGMAGRRAPVRTSARLSNSGEAARAAAAGSSSSGGRQANERAAAAVARRERAAERAREVEDSPSELRDKCRRLVRALRNAKHLVVYTGAGISTAADIPDYRGPHGVWTRLQRGEAVGRVEVARARPTFTHMALTALWARGTLKFVVSQNCDGLHVRAGLPRRALAELHGNMFAERCEPCRRVYLRAFDTTERTARHAHGTRRLCHACGAELRDSIVHFGERGRAAWPLNWAGALRHAAAADVVLCLGSSLKVLRRYPRLWRMHSAPSARPDLYIVNLQWTPKDAVAKLKINARCDAVMAQVARRLRLRVPRYCAARDPLLAHAEPLLPHEAHTTRRTPLSHPASPSLSPTPTPTPSPSRSASASASDSDDEVPLRRLAERMRADAPDAPQPAPAHAYAHASPPSWESSRPPGRCPSAPPQVPVVPSSRSPSMTWMPEVPQSPTPTPRATEPPMPPTPPTPPTLLTPSASPRPAPVALPDLLHAFQVNMKSGDATILLRAEHAPSVTGAAIAAPRASPVRALRAMAPAALAPRPRAPSLLRRFRMARPPPAPPPAPPLANGHAPPAAAWRLRCLLQCAPRPPPPQPPQPPADAMEHDRQEKPTVGGDGHANPRAAGGHHCDHCDHSDHKMDVDCESKIKIKLEAAPQPRPRARNGFDFDSKPKIDFLLEPKTEVEGRTKSEVEYLGESETEGGGAVGGCAAALAAALIARAVLLCRAQLYPGLHSMIAPVQAAAAAAACAWCARHCAARRCLWYGPPALTPPQRRAARRLRQRRYLCACCPPAPPAAAAAAAACARAHLTPQDDSGWYGKGYRKGRRCTRARR